MHRLSEVGIRRRCWVGRGRSLLRLLLLLRVEVVGCARVGSRGVADRILRRRWGQVCRSRRLLKLVSLGSCSFIRMVTRVLVVLRCLGRWCATPASCPLRHLLRGILANGRASHGTSPVVGCILRLRCRLWIGWMPHWPAVVLLLLAGIEVLCWPGSTWRTGLQRRIRSRWLSWRGKIVTPDAVLAVGLG